jgi:hypothetical protein
VDLLSSGPERPRRAARIWRRRSVRAAAVILVTAAALLLLRSTVDPSPSTVDPPVAAGTPATAPPRPTPPFDRLPGRTPIPEPAQTGDALSGRLPGTGPLGKSAAGRAVDLVLGRYCADPAVYTYTLGPDTDGRAADWHHVDVAVFSLERSGAGPALRLFLDWAGSSYRWLGFLNLLFGC